MNIAIGTQIPAATAHIISTGHETNAVKAHRLATTWAKAAAKKQTSTKAWAAEIAEMLVTSPDTDDLASLNNWLATK